MPAIPPAPERKAPPLEKVIQADIRAWLAREPDVTIFRNAQAYCTFPDGHKARTGLGPGSADLVGSLTIKVDGMTLARAMGIEIKRPGQRLDPDQVVWHDEMRRRGWIVGVARSVDDAKEIVAAARRGELPDARLCR